MKQVLSEKTRHLRVIAAVFAVLFAAVALSGKARAASFHDFNFQSIEGRPMSLEAFRGKPVLVVNTASFCGFTYQYGGLAELWSRYKSRGLVILGVPSNDFGAQEYDTDGEVKEFCEVTYGIDFPMTSIQKVKGAEAHPLYKWLAGQLGAKNTPRWNFHKYLVTPDGKAVEAWPSRVEPMSKDVIAAIEKHLPE